MYPQRTGLAIDSFDLETTLAFAQTEVITGFVFPTPWTKKLQISGVQNTIPANRNFSAIAYGENTRCM